MALSAFFLCEGPAFTELFAIARNLGVGGQNLKPPHLVAVGVGKVEQQITFGLVWVFVASMLLSRNLSCSRGRSRTSNKVDQLESFTSPSMICTLLTYTTIFIGFSF